MLLTFSALDRLALRFLTSHRNPLEGLELYMDNIAVSLTRSVAIMTQCLERNLYIDKPCLPDQILPSIKLLPITSLKEDAILLSVEMN